MNVARAQFDRLLDEIIDRTHDGRAAGQVAQIVHALIGGPDLALAAAAGCFDGIMFVAQNRCDVLERGRYDFEGLSKNDFRSPQRLSVSRIARRNRNRSIAGFERE